MPQHLEDAMWRVESAGIEGCLPTLRGLTPLIVCGMGGSAIGGGLAPGGAGPRLGAPDPAVDKAADHDARLRAADLGDPRLGRAVRELLRQHRGDAGLL